MKFFQKFSQEFAPRAANTIPTPQKRQVTNMLVTNRKTDYFEKRAGGTGTTIMEHIVDESVYGGKIAAYARVVLKPGCSLGYHKHEGTSETLYILSGTAEYNDNGTPCTLKAGDVAFCPEGESHSVGNSATATEDLVIMALIVNEN